MKNKPNIWIFGDDMENTGTSSNILTALGHPVEIANDGLRAIQKVKTEPFDAVLMDKKMPGINGSQTYKEIKQIQPKDAVIMMTAYAVENLVTEALKEGAYGVRYKPVEITKVIRLVEHSSEKGALILIVDDDLSTCETLIDILKKKGCSFAQVHSGEEAKRMVKEKAFDIVLIDVKMPILNGLETYLELRKIRPQIQASMMTAYRQEVQNLVEEAQRHNIYTCIYKPFDMEKLLKIIERIMAGKKKAEIQQIAVD